MAEVPTRDWTDDDLVSWLRPGLDWLQEQWQESDAAWSDLRPGFLEQLDVSEADLAADDGLRVPYSLLWHVDNDLATDDSRRQILLDETAVLRLVADFAEPWRSAGEQAGDAAGPAGSAEDVTPEEASAEIATLVAAPALAHVLQEVPEAAQLSPAELHALLGEVIAERLARA